MRKVEAKLSEILYHKTGETAAIKILLENQFRLSTWLGTSADAPDAKKSDFHWFLSTANHKMSEGASGGGVTFVLDGRRLAQKYAGSPFDYFGSTMRNAARDDTFRKRLDEAEERIWSKKPTIPNADQYIKEIHAWWNVRYGDHYEAVDYRRCRQLTMLAKLHKIPIYWYADNKDFKLLVKPHAKKFSDFPGGKSMTSEDLADEGKYGGQSAYSAKQWRDLLKIYDAKTYEELPKNCYSLLSYEGISCNIHNASKSMKPQDMHYVTKVSKQMQLMGVKSLKEYVMKLDEKVAKMNKERLKVAASFKEYVKETYALSTKS